MYDIIALGELLIDFATVDSDADGYPVMAAHPGGAPANYLAAANKYGCKTAFIGKVGADAFGCKLVKTLEKAGIYSGSVIMSEDYFTTLAFVTIDENGNRDFTFSRKHGADLMLSYGEVDLSLLDEAKILHFGTLSLTADPVRDTTCRLINYAKQKGLLISLDPNLRKPLWDSLEKAKEAMLYGLSVSDIVKISDDEVDFLWGIGPEEGAQKILADFDVKLVFVTCGAEGAVFANKNAMGHVPGLKNIHPLDTTGAGDIFGGSAASRIIAAGKNPDELTMDELRSITGFACAAASLSTLNFGGISSVPEKAEVEKIINS